MVKPQALSKAYAKDSIVINGRLWDSYVYKGKHLYALQGPGYKLRFYPCFWILKNKNHLENPSVWFMPQNVQNIF